MARLLYVLALAAVAGCALGGGYGNDVTEPPPPPPAPTYGPVEPEAAPTEAPIYYYDAPAPAEEEAPIEEEAAPEAPEIDEAEYIPEPAYYAPEPAAEEEEAPIEEAPADEIIEDIPLTETISYMEEIAPIEDPAAPGGYRKRFRRRKVKRTFALKRASESDLRLRLIKNCRDNHPRCSVWAGIKAVKTADGQIRRVNECRTNPFMTTMEGCPRSCGVCTPNPVEFKLRRRNARVLRRRRLAKKTV